MAEDPRNDRERDPRYEDYLAERDFERRYGRRRAAGESEAAPDGRFAERRSWWNRTGDEVSAWFGDRDALRRRQWDEAVGDHRGKGPKDYVRTDARILDEINERLTDDPDLDASNIEVAVASGEATLEGQVTTKADKRLAEDIAESARGVVQVRNNLRVG
ncbi:MAG TPA: BON domain-containing protein [Caulobacteraceae bacterium]|nr:BON domain-containing protein [Caulobacteraceae bacterium]